MSEPFIVVGFKAKVGKEGELRRDLSVLVEPSRSEDGNIIFVTSAFGRMNFNPV